MSFWQRLKSFQHFVEKGYQIQLVHFRLNCEFRIRQMFISAFSFSRVKQISVVCSKKWNYRMAPIDVCKACVQSLFCFPPFKPLISYDPSRYERKRKFLSLSKGVHNLRAIFRNFSLKTCATNRYILVNLSRNDFHTDCVREETMKNLNWIEKYSFVNLMWKVLEY